MPLYLQVILFNLLLFFHGGELLHHGGFPSFERIIQKTLSSSAMIVHILTLISIVLFCFKEVIPRLRQVVGIPFPDKVCKRRKVKVLVVEGLRAAGLEAVEGTLFVLGANHLGNLTSQGFTFKIFISFSFHY